jgi:hypothetical protein
VSKPIERYMTAGSPSSAAAREDPEQRGADFVGYNNGLYGNVTPSRAAPDSRRFRVGLTPIGAGQTQFQGRTVYPVGRHHNLRSARPIMFGRRQNPLGGRPAFELGFV